MKLFIIGHGRHGKDTVAEMIRDEFELTFESSSMFAAETVVRPWLESRHGIKYDSVKDCYEDRGNHRSKWFDAISEFNADDFSRLSREIFKQHDMYVGLRNRNELIASKHLSDLAIWVDASERVSPEDQSSCTILRSDADIVIDNNGTLEELRERVFRLGIALLV